MIGQGKKLDRSIRHGMHWLLGVIQQQGQELEERVQVDIEQHKERELEEKRERAKRVCKLREERYDARKTSMRSYMNKILHNYT